MRGGLIQNFGSRMRARIKAVGFTNLSALMSQLRISTSFVTGMLSGKQRDAGAMKIAHIAIMLGRRPSELFAEIDDLLLNPEPLSADELSEMCIPGPASRYDLFRLAIVADVVVGWDAEMNRSTPQSEIGELIGAVYDEIVAADRTITPLELRRRAMARVFGIDLPEISSPPRGRGRPSSADAA